MRFLDSTLLEQVGAKAVEMCHLSVYISCLSHVVHSGQALGQGTVGAI